MTGTALAMYLCYQCHIIYTDEKLTDPVRTRRGIRPAPRMRTHSVNDITDDILRCTRHARTDTDTAIYILKCTHAHDTVTQSRIL